MPKCMLQLWMLRTELSHWQISIDIFSITKILHMLWRWSPAVHEILQFKWLFITKWKLKEWQNCVFFSLTQDKTFICWKLTENAFSENGNKYVPSVRINVHHLQPIRLQCKVLTSETPHLWNKLMLR